jgi:serine protease Do
VALLQGKLGTGTGFLVKPRVLVTNKHVVQRELIRNLKIHFPSAGVNQQGPLTGSLLYVDDEKDLALLSVETHLPPLVTARDYTFRRGQEVLVIGNPGLSGDIVLTNAVSSGLMSTETVLAGQRYYQLGISVNEGNSGGPVLDEGGQVIGVLTLKATQQEGLGFCIPVSDLNRVLGKLASLSKADIEATECRHHRQAVFTLLFLAGGLYRSGMTTYTQAMDRAVHQGQEPRVGLVTVQVEVATRLKVLDAAVLAELEEEVARISADASVPEGIRQKLADLWANYQDFRSYVENPRGNLASYNAKLRELSDRQDNLGESLRLLLGIK